MAGLLLDLHAVDEARGVTLHLEAHGLLDGAQGVDVLRLGAGTELCAALLAQGKVRVHAHGALVHAGVGHAESLDQVAQRGDVGARKLRGPLAGALDWLRNDFNQRHAGAVAVH